MQFLCLVLMLVSSFGFAETFDLSKIQSSKVEWLAVGSPGFLKIESKNMTVTGEMTIDNGMIAGTFVSHLDDMKTGIALRDSHTKEKYLETKKYPDAKFTLNPVKVASSFKATGEMYLHGKSQEMEWKCQAAKDDGVRKISCLSTIVLTDFGIAVPSYLGVTVAKDVKVKVILVI